MFPFRSILVSLLTVAGAVSLGAQQSTQPEEVVPVGPGYITKGYKTMVNGQVVQTTDGQIVQPNSTSPAPNPTIPAATAPTGSWPSVIMIIDGVVIDPETGQPVNNLPEAVELIPLGLRKINPNSITGGQVDRSEKVAPYFRVVDQQTPQPTSKPRNEHPASIQSESGPDFSDLITSAESVESEPTKNENAESEDADPEERGGFFNFLFGSYQDEVQPSSDVEDGKKVINLDEPLTNEEMAMVQSHPEFQDFLRKRSNTSRNFYASKGRGGSARNETPAPPKAITIEEFNPEEWEVSGPTPPTPNIAIGKLVSVNTDRQIAVCWLQTRYLRPNSPMVTRNYELQTTGVIIPSGEQDGRSAGFWIAEGNPRPGDEVIVPGPQYSNLVERWKDKATSAQ